MHDDDYIDIPITHEMLEDPDEPGIHPLEAMSRRLDAFFVKSGKPYSRMERKPDAEPRYQVTFVPNRGAIPPVQQLPRTLLEDCPSCGTQLDNKGRCRACWGDVFGFCEKCAEILSEDGSCQSRTTTNFTPAAP